MQNEYLISFICQKVQSHVTGFVVRIRRTLFILRGQLGWFGCFGVKGLNVLVDFQKKLKSTQSVFESRQQQTDQEMIVGLGLGRFEL